jgi:hypothetical protein
VSIATSIASVLRNHAGLPRTSAGQAAITGSPTSGADQ